MFFSTVTRTTVLLHFWTTSTLAGTVLAILSGGLLSLGLECLKCYIVTQRMIADLNKRRSKRLFILQRVVWSLRHITDVLVGYLLMLLVMTFDIYIFLAVIVGAGLGYFCFRPIFLDHVNKKMHCHQVSNTLNFSMEDVCHCSRTSDVHDHGQKMESSGGIVKFKEEEIAQSPYCNPTDPSITEANETQV